MNVTVSPASSAFIVIASSFPAHFNIFACEEFKIKPRETRQSTASRASTSRARASPPATAPFDPNNFLFTVTRPPSSPTRRHAASPTRGIARADRAPRTTRSRVESPRAARVRAATPARRRRSTHHIRQVHPHRQRAIASVVLEAIGVKLERDQRDVARIHGLEFETFDGVGLEVGVGDEVLDRVEDFLEHGALLDSGFEHGRSGRWGVKYRAMARAVTAEIWKKNLKFGGFQVAREREESATGERARKRG